MDFNIPRMTAYVQEILKTAGYEQKHAQAFVELSLDRHRNFHKLGFDEFGRRIIPFELTPEILLNDFPWFTKLLEQMHIGSDHLAILQGKIYVVDGNRGLPLTKALAKKQDVLFSVKKNWYKYHEGRERFFNKPEVFLAELGSVINLGKIAVVSINPGDYLRKSFFPDYTNFTSCHHLRTGAYRWGCVNYSLDRFHLVNYVANGTDERQKMLGRVMMVVSEDLNVVAQRRFYPSPDEFGPTRARRIREEVHKMINPDANWKRSSEVTMESEGGNGYIDGITIVTYLDKSKKYQDIAMCNDVFCFKCGKVHQHACLFCC